MFQNTIISDELSIYKFFKKLNFDLYLTKPKIKHLERALKTYIVELIWTKFRETKQPIYFIKKNNIIFTIT